MFRAKTTHANRLKALFELLFNNLKTVCFTIDKDGMHLKAMTTINLLLEVKLLAENFDEYVFTFEEPVHIGIESYVNKSFKTMKSKNIVTMSIVNPGELVIDVKSTSKDNYSYSLSLLTQNVQSVTPIPLVSYASSSMTNVPTSVFSDMCKQIKCVSQFSVTREHGLLKFKCNTPADVYSETFVFGKEDPSDTLLVHDVYKSEQLTRMAKIVSFAKDSSKFVQVYVEANKHMMICAKSELGTINAYFLYTRSM